MFSVAIFFTATSLPFQASLLMAIVSMSFTQQQSLSLEQNSQPLPDHSILLLTAVGEDAATAVRCLTSRTDCCATGTAGSEDSNWISPSGVPLENLTSTPVGVQFYRSRVSGGIDLFRRNGSGAPEGVYRCEIVANSSTTLSVNVLHIGLYLEGNGELQVCHIQHVQWPVENIVMRDAS